MNARRFLITATAVLVVASVVAQQKQGHASAPFKKNQGKMSVIDSTKLRVWYAMNADSLLDMNTYVDYQRLDVGDSIAYSVCFCNRICGGDENANYGREQI